MVYRDIHYGCLKPEIRKLMYKRLALRQKLRYYKGLIVVLEDNINKLEKDINAMMPQKD